MAQSINLSEIQRRPARYWNADGLPELMMGLLWTLWGGAWLLGESLAHGTVWTLFWMFAPALLALGGVASIWATKQLKARITFPRTGYVEWREPTRGQRLGTAAVAMVCAALLAAVSVKARTRGVDNTAPLVLTVVLSLAFLVASVTQHAPHLRALAGVALTLGLAVTALDGGLRSMNWILIGVGVATSFAGAIRLFLFVRQNPREERV
jgi:peptidoglycan/LPS O-acetylase OafA/YrhL